MLNILMNKHFSYYVLVLLMLSIGKVYAEPFAYITNQGEHTVSVVDLDTNKVTATIPVGKSPVGVAIDVLKSRLYVTNVEGRSVSIIDMTSNQVLREIKLDIAPVGILLSNTGKQLFVADWYNDHVLVFDTETLNQIATIDTAKAPAGMVLVVMMQRSMWPIAIVMM